MIVNSLFPLLAAGGLMILPAGIASSAPAPAPAPKAADATAGEGEAALLRKADALRESGDNRRALPLYRKAAAINPGNGATYNKMGLCLLGLDEPDKALKAFKRAVEKDPGDSAYYYNIGHCHVLMKQLDPAIVYYKKAVADNPENGIAQFDLASAYFVKREFEKARRHYEKAAAAFGYDTIQGRDSLRNAIKVEMLMKRMGEEGGGS